MSTLAHVERIYNTERGRAERSYRASLIAILKQRLAPFFQANPNLISVRWGQGSFYDDQEWYFRAEIDKSDLVINGKRLIDPHWAALYELDERAEKELEPLFPQIAEVLSAFSEEQFKHMFGAEEHGMFVGIVRKGNQLEIETD